MVVGKLVLEITLFLGSRLIKQAYRNLAFELNALNGL